MDAAARDGGGGGVAESSRQAGSVYDRSHYKKRFCASYPNVAQCRRGKACAFAHSREELRVQLLTEDEENQFPDAMGCDFFMTKYKTLWCPVGVQHDWLKCPYAHNYQDARRPVHIGYGAKLCPFWSKKQVHEEYSQRCPLGLRCPYAHGAKEQLYHPQYFRTAVCRDLRGRRCPRADLCAFFHKRTERRRAGPDEVDYQKPLSEGNLPAEWVAEYLAQPFNAVEGAAPPSPEQQPSGHPALAGWYAPPVMAPGIPWPPESPSRSWETSPMHVPAYIQLPPGHLGIKDAESPRTQSTASGDRGDLDISGEGGDAEASASSWAGAYSPLYPPVPGRGMLLGQPWMNPYDEAAIRSLWGGWPGPHDSSFWWSGGKT